MAPGWSLDLDIQRIQSPIYLQGSRKVAPLVIDVAGAQDSAYPEFVRMELKLTSSTIAVENSDLKKSLLEWQAGLLGQEWGE